MTTIIRPQAPQAKAAVAFAFGDFDNERAFEREQQLAAAVAGRVDEQLAASLPAVHAAVEAIRASQAQWLAHWQHAALAVAIAIAERVIRREVKHAPEITLDLVTEALELAAGSAEVQLRMHPDDLATLGRHVDEIAANLNRLGEVKVVADGAITRGGCRVDTRYGTIDQQFAAQLARIELELA
jgi:flagellar assembly protein FliH